MRGLGPGHPRARPARCPGAPRAVHPTGLAWLQGFRDAVTQAEAEFRAEVGNDVATVVAIGLEAYAGRRLTHAPN